MTQDRTSKLSFSIEESVWLNKGQQVDEIVSLSLDPEITVEENGDYVLVRGGLKLTGEYRTNGNQEVTEQQSLSLSNQVAFRSIEEVTVNEDGTGEIRHTFPIDVTIPQERIHNLDEIYVLVESFDYDLPERGCIQLTADVAITGMSSEMQLGKKQTEEREYDYPTEQYDFSQEDYRAEEDFEQKDIEQEETDQVSVPDEVDADEDRTFHYESYNQEEAEQDILADEQQYGRDQSVVSHDQQEGEFEEQYSGEFEEETTEDEVELKTRDEDEVENTEVDEEPEAIVENKSPSVAFGVIKDRPKLEDLSNDSAEPQEQKQDFSFSKLKSLAGERRAKERKVDKAEVVVEEVEIDNVLDESLTNQHAGETEKQKPPRQENALYLTKMLTKGEEEEFKKLKMCIIQQNETLNTIAARYEVNESTLIRINKLDDSNVEEGQILYIPV